jgi:hypothetical protein
MNKIGKGVEGRGHALNGCSVVVFTWETEENHENLNPTSMFLDIPSMKEEFCPL